MSVRIPESAVWFGLETRKGPEHPWERFETEEGEKWWRTATVVPEELAAQEGLLPPSFVGEEVRATFSPADRRRTLGHSLPMETPADEEGADDDDGGQVVDLPPPPQQAPPPPPQQPPPPAAARRRVAPRSSNGQPAPGPPTPADALRRHPPQVNPVVPLPPNADHNLMTFWTLQQLAQTQADRLIALVMSYNQHAIEAERARSEQVLQQTRDYFSAIENNQRQLQAAMMSASKSDQTPVVVHQLQQHIQAQAHAIQALGTKLEELEDEDDDGEPFPVPSFSDEPNNVERVFAGIQGIVGAVANSPMAEPLAEMLKRRPVVPPPPQQQHSRQPPLPFTFPPPQQQGGEQQGGADGQQRTEDDIPPPPPQ